MLDVNLYQTGFLTKLLLKKFYTRARQGKKSAIVIVTSGSGLDCWPGAVLYSATKAFQTSITLSLGYDLNQENFTQSNFIQSRLFDKNLIDI